MEDFEKLTDEQGQKQFLGNYMYQFALKDVQKNEEVEDKDLMAGRVTGMILDGQTVEYLLFLCTDKKAFFALVNEAVNMIRSAEAQ